MLLILVVGIIALIRHLVAGGPVLKNKGLDRSVRREIARLARANNFLQAGDVAWRVEAWEDAADFYVKGKDFVRAADAFLRANKRSESINYYKRAGQFRRAAELYEKNGQLRHAAQEYLQAGETARAADLFLKAREFRRAGELFEELGQWRDAGEAYERIHDQDSALAAFGKYLEQEFKMRRGRNHSFSADFKKRAREIAKLMHSKGQVEPAAHILEQLGHKAQAAQLLAQSGDHKKAADLYLQANKPEEAARLFAQQGDLLTAARYRAEAAAKQGDVLTAAREWEAAGEPARAAELYADAGEGRRAAALFEKVGEMYAAAQQYIFLQDHANAGRCYEASGDDEAAADLYLRAEDVEGALRCYTRGERWFPLGELLLRQDRFEEALVAFQRVPPASTQYRQACDLQGDILRRARPSVALEKYRAAIQDQAPRADNLEGFYKIALLLEEMGEQEEARRTYEKILAVDYYFKDARTRMEGLVAARVSTSGAQARMIRGNGRYEIISEIARGGMGVVYRAHDRILDRDVAYKILSENLKTNPTAVKYFLREAKAAASLSHPNIVAVFDAGEQDGEYYMAMELLQGETLKSLVTRSGPFHEKLLRFVLMHACRGLDYAHAHSIVHRDIKSGNIMLTRDKSIKLMDFGLAKSLETASNEHTKAIGTPFYMSPEQILGKDLDHRSDLYSLGVTLFECATGTVPFYKGELSYHHLHTQPPRPRSLNPNLSEPMEQIILKLLQKDPDQRFPSAQAILKALRPR